MNINDGPNRRLEWLRQFEEEFLDLKCPDLLDYVDRSGADDRDEFLRALIIRELQLFRKTGNLPDREEYLAKFLGPDLEIARATFDSESSEESELMDSNQAATDGDRVPPTIKGSAGFGSRRPGDTIGKYSIHEYLGGGGMGETYKAKHQEMPSRWVVLKLIREHLVTDKHFVARFQQEIDRLAALGSHPNVVMALDAGVMDSCPYFVMEYVDGEDLAKVINRSGILPIIEACRLAQQVARGLQHLSDHQTVHRDIKPSNLLRSTRGSAVKIADFGLAFLVQGGSTITLPGETFGSPDYISPEQATNSHSVDIRADIYSLGCTLYHLLAGQPPFPEGNAYQKLLRHSKDEPMPVERLRPDLPPGLANVIRRMMAKQPENRYPTPAEVVEALEIYTHPTECPVNRGNRPKRIGLATVVLVLLLFAGLLTYLKVPKDAPRALHMVYTDQAWDYYRAKDYKKAIEAASLCVKDFQGDANRIQKQLLNQSIDFPEGKASPEVRDKIFQNGVLNDVATCLWIMGRSLEETQESERARQAYQQAALLNKARCWNPDDQSFWSPGLKANDTLEALGPPSGQ
ncbi:serine/threonine protein kinase [Tundrisphaera lichenicola]|uniref:serine/threonine protein kinase n=1 Tax=Tundrisphaera lichenicola TaxID=2029860 RepID=UPI003EBE31DF